MSYKLPEGATAGAATGCIELVCLIGSEGGDGLPAFKPTAFNSLPVLTSNLWLDYSESAELKEIAFDNEGGGAAFIGRLSHIIAFADGDDNDSGIEKRCFGLFVTASPSVFLILMSTRTQSGRCSGRLPGPRSRRRTHECRRRDLSGSVLSFGECSCCCRLSGCGAFHSRCKYVGSCARNGIFMITHFA